MKTAEALVYLVHAANILYFASYATKDILLLRVLTVIACCLLIPYFYSQPTPLMVPIYWQIIFIGVNLVQIGILIHERRPIQLAEEEQLLYQRVFRALTPREFMKLLRVGQFRDVPTGERLAAQGAEGIDMVLIVRGRAEVRVDGVPVAELREWQFVGEMSFLTDKAATADVVAIEPTRYVDWPRAALREFLRKNPSLVAPMRLVIGTDLIAKLNRPPAGKSSRAEQGV